jgi:hypothetical protein
MFDHEGMADTFSISISIGSAEQPVEHLDAITIGTGFSGICLLHELPNRSFHAKMYEAADGIGGLVCKSLCRSPGR